MKTKNNVQKAILRSGAVIISFVLISFTVAAQGFWKQLLTNNSMNEIAMVLANNSTENIISNEESINLPSQSATLFNVYLEKASEQGLEIENWMFDETYFGANYYWLEEAKDDSNDLEDWMMDESYFETKTDSDESLEVEAWMTNNKYWNS